jgi:DsbC/DsbD-like thiol-disulfide interchange protein
MFAAAIGSDRGPDSSRKTAKSCTGKTTFLSACLTACLAFCLAVAITPAHASEASDWSGNTQAGARLIAGGDADQTGSRIRRAGVEIRLAPGWKTYWRYPGDSGVPPHFDFSGSENVKNVTVLWPAPRRFTADDDITIGYKDNVIFPLRIEPQRTDQPMLLRLTFDYAICEKICVPAEARLELRLDGTHDTILDRRLSAAEARVPHQVSGAGLAIISVQRDKAAPERVLVDVKTPAGIVPELFVEGPSPDWALPVPVPVAGAAEGAQRFAFALDGLPRGAKARGAVLTFTATAGTEAIEIRHPLD